MFRPLQKQAMTLLGKLKYFSKPPIIVYDPSSYKVKGADVRELLGVLQPGDILLRAYDGYLDSWFIRSSRPLDKGSRRRGVFTHAALYVGRLGPQDRDRAAADISGYAWDQDRAIPAAELPAHREAMRERFFDSVLKPDQAGNWPDNAMVIHAMAEGVQMEDILSFCRCDYLQVLRLPAQFQGVPHAELPPVFRLQADSEEARLAGSLLADQCLQREDATRLACAAALGKLAGVLLLSGGRAVAGHAPAPARLSGPVAAPGNGDAGRLYRDAAGNRVAKPVATGAGLGGGGCGCG